MKLYGSASKRIRVLLILTLVILCQTVRLKAGSIFIRGKINPDLICDSVQLTWTQFGVENYPMNMVEEITVAVKMGEFIVRIPHITQPIALNIIYKNKLQYVSRFPGGYYMEKNDSLFIDDSQRTDKQPFKIFFHGKSSLKMEYQRNFMEQSANLEKGFPSTHLLSRANVNSLDSLSNQQLIYLNKLKPFLSSKAYLYLKVKILTNCEVMKYMGPTTYRIKSTFSFANTALQDSIEKLSNLRSLDLETCAEFYSYAFYKYKYDSAIVFNRMKETKDYFNYFLLHYSGNVRELLITQLLLTYKFPEINECIERSLRFIKNQKYRNALRLLQQNIQAKNILDFNLMDTAQIFHSLKHNFKDSIVLIDFWFTGCGGCLQMKPYIDTLMERYKSLPVKFVSISSDSDFSTWKNSVTHQRYTSIGTVNLYTNGLGEKSPIIKFFNIVSYPTIIVLDKNRNIMPLPTDPRLDNYQSLEKIIHSLL